MNIRRWLILAGIVVGVLVLALFIAGRRVSPGVRDYVVRTLSERLDSEVALEGFEVGLLPYPRVSGKGLTIRYQARTDIPPLIVVGAFHARTTWLGAFARRVSEVNLEGLEIAIPPRRGADMPVVRASSSGDAGADLQQADSEGSSDQGQSPSPGIDLLVSTNARLSILPKQQGKDPRVFDIFTLTMHDLTLAGPATFEAELTNPVPVGRINTEGTFGPWTRGEPSATPLDGRYTFDADLGTIKGIAGHLTSDGEFRGVLDRIVAAGKTETPDFSIPKLRAAALPLATVFDAVIDGTNGDVVLDRVDAKLARSSFLAKGSVTGTRGVKGRRVTLDITSDSARMEDILRLTVRTPEPAMTGLVKLRTAFDLPQGDRDVPDRLLLDGKLAIKSGLFTTDRIQSKVDELSRRGSGRPEDESIDNVVSNLTTAYALKNGVITIQGLTYSVPGATIVVNGTYGLESGALDFSGVAQLEASVSNTVTGLKHFLLMPLNPLLRKGGAGTRLAFSVTGTVDDPKIGLDLGKTLKGR